MIKHGQQGMFDGKIRAYLDADVLGYLPGSYRLMPDDKDSLNLCISRNVFWEEAYQHVMQGAQVMVFVLTDAWLSSPWCQQEMGWALGAGHLPRTASIIIAYYDDNMKTMLTSPGAALKKYKFDLYTEYKNMLSLFGAANVILERMNIASADATDPTGVIAIENNAPALDHLNVLINAELSKKAATTVSTGANSTYETVAHA